MSNPSTTETRIGKEISMEDIVNSGDEMNRIYFFSILLLVYLLHPILCLAGMSQKADSEPGRYPIWDGKGWGAIDSKGKIVVKPVFLDRFNFSEGLAPVENKEGKYGYIDLNGKWAIPPKFAFAFPFSNKRAEVRDENGKIGVVDERGNYVVHSNYYNSSQWSEGMASVAVKAKNDSFDKCGCWGYVDDTDKMVIRPSFDNAFPFMNGAALVIQDEKYGLIDAKGNYLVKPRFEDAQNSRWGIFIRQGAKWGAMDKTGKFLIKPRYEEIGGAYDSDPFSVNRMVVKAGGKYGFVDSKGNLVVKPLYDYANSYDPKTGLAGVGLNNKFGFIDRNGNLAIPFQYGPPNLEQWGNNEGYQFDPLFGLSAVRKDGKWGFIDQTGKVIIPFRYDEIGFFSSEGICPVVLYGKRIEGDPEMKLGYIDLKGNYIWKADHDI